MTRTRICWVVSIHDTGVGDTEPFESGPWPEGRARKIAEGFNATHEDKGWFATSYPLTRYGVRELRKMHEENLVGS